MGDMPSSAGDRIWCAMCPDAVQPEESIRVVIPASGRRQQPFQTTVHQACARRYGLQPPRQMNRGRGS